MDVHLLVLVVEQQTNSGDDKMIKKCLIGGLIMGAIVAFLINILSYVFFSSRHSEEYTYRMVSKFIVETRAVWKNTCNDFYHARQAVYISREAGISEREVMIRELSKLTEDKRRISNVPDELVDENQKRSAKNVLILISNATDELKRAVEADDIGSIERCIDNANKEIELANVKFLKIAEDNELSIDPLTLVRKGLDN